MGKSVFVMTLWWTTDKTGVGVVFSKLTTVSVVLVIGRVRRYQIDDQYS